MSVSEREKAALRKRLSQRRRDLEPDQRFLASRQLETHLAPLIEHFESVAAFAATQTEVDLSHLYESLLRSNVRLFFPRVMGPGQMVFARVQSLDDLEPGAFGILEPRGEPAAVESIDAFLVPGLAFDGHGVRLGFGGGYYDRALEAFLEPSADRPLLIGVGYSWQVVDVELPVDEWDVRLSHVATENGVLQMSR